MSGADKAFSVRVTSFVSPVNPLIAGEGSTTLLQLITTLVTFALVIVPLGLVTTQVWTGLLGLVTMVTL